MVSIFGSLPFTLVPGLLMPRTVTAACQSLVNVTKGWRVVFYLCYTGASKQMPFRVAESCWTKEGSESMKKLLLVVLLCALTAVPVYADTPICGDACEEYYEVCVCDPITNKPDDLGDGKDERGRSSP